jgi:translation initiation factor 3 subunit F
MAGPAPLTLPAGVTENSVKVHPVVLFTICDAYIRRNEGQARVIGTLLGKVGDGIIDIRNCYAVPHTESDQVRITAHLEHQFSILIKINASR